MSATVERVLVVGWDGASFTVLQPLLDAGHLPNLAAIQRKGAWQELLSTIPPVTAPAWATFMTGKNPGQHGVFNFFRRDPTGYAYEDTAGFVDGRAIHGATLWDVAGHAGRQVGIVNVPLSYPPRSVNGFLITGMLTPASAQQFTYPPELAETLTDYLIDLDYVRGDQGWSLGGTSDGVQLIADVERLLETRARNVLRLMHEERWDLFVAVFVGTDRLFHALWPHLAADGQSGPLRDAAVGYMRRLDAVLGEMRTLAGPDAVTLVLSDHGFGPAPSQRVNLNEWLRDLGLLVVDTSRGRLRDPGYWAVRLGLRRPGVRRWLERLFPRHRLRQLAYGRETSKVIPADWSRTQAHAVQLYNQYCGIEINRLGHKRQGIVPDGERYESLRDLLLAGLADLRDPRTGHPLVRIAWRREALYSGAYVDTAPDVILELEPEYAGLSPLGTGELVTGYHPARSGDHRREGIFLADGPGIGMGRLPVAPGLADVAPTILHLLGVPIPEDMDGQVIESVLDPPYLAQNPPQRGSVFARDAEAGLVGEATEQEVEEIRDRLRGLGYLE